MEKSKARVLIVDDEEFFRLLMKKIATNLLNYEVVGEACDGEEALEMFKELNPDIVLLDIIMPKIPGNIILKYMKEHNPEACIIMMSSVSDEETMKVCLEYGAACYIMKDTPISEIEKIIPNIWYAYSSLKNALS